MLKGQQGMGRDAVSQDGSDLPHVDKEVVSLYALDNRLSDGDTAPVRHGGARPGTGPDRGRDRNCSPCPPPSDPCPWQRPR
ncbi:hypothetical protein GCM10010339_66110 [Streptomyces alanosinicus]|uniref:Uncharacterized protein n=1 Tax=Streptomyces alanosinicus TaxID=68171 RepID=A0A919D4R7_9ACTN|nr:hypothetical protein GCM10010339_66110 [Streptomyces alanosinicus]